MLLGRDPGQGRWLVLDWAPLPSPYNSSNLISCKSDRNLMYFSRFPELYAWLKQKEVSTLQHYSLSGERNHFFREDIIRKTSQPMR